MKTKKIIIFFALSLLLSLLVCAENPKIKVGINFGNSAIKQSLKITFQNGFQTGYTSDDNMFMPIMFYGDNDVTVNAVGNLIRLTSSDGSVLFEGSEGQPVSICPLGSELDGEGHIPYTTIGSIKYPDVLEFSAKGGLITVINIVDSEQYFKGVLPSEIYPSWHEEALKTAAIAARTFTYHSIGGKHKNYGVDVCTTTCCQVYSGITKCQESTNKAVDDTKNLVLTYNGKVITCVYHAISGGITQSAAGTWGGNPESFPYLTIVETPFENYTEIARGKWIKVIYDDDFNKLISNSSYRGQLSAPIKITVDDPTPGYINNITMTGSNGGSVTLKNSDTIRSFFSTWSANFTIGNVYMPYSGAFDSATVLTSSGEVQLPAGQSMSILTSAGGEVIQGIKHAHYLDGKGYGHGVGLSQYGAQFAAKAGYTYDQILAIYFPGTIIEDYTLLTNK